MFNKLVTSSISIDDIEIIDSELIKTAAFKLPDNIQYDPDFLYMRVRGVSSGEVFGANKNNDWFPEEELKLSFKTFLTAHAFKNHENKDIANAIGDILSAEWDQYMHGVMLLIRIDKKIAPSIVRGFEKGFMTDVSMGCRVDHSVCSICGKKAKTQKDYCDHIRFFRGKIFDDGKKVYEINIGPKFHDISAVLNGAEKVAKVTGLYVDNGKLAFSLPQETGMDKAASFEEAFCDAQEYESEKSASFVDKDIFPDRELSKEAYVQKIAEIKKTIESNIIDVANKEVVDDLAGKSNIARDILRSINEEYWPYDKCEEIGEMLLSLSDEREVSPETVFNQFLKVTSFLGVELSPREFELISSKVLGLRSKGSLPVIFNSNSPVESFRKCDEAVSRDLKAIHLISKNEAIPMISIGKILKSLSGFESDLQPAQKPRIMITIVAKPPIDNSSSDLFGEMAEKMKNLLFNRSIYSPYMFKKADNNIDNSDQFNFSSTFKQAAYALYQQNRMNQFDQDDFAEKVAYYTGDIFPTQDDILISKTASALGKGYTSRKALVYGLPLTYGYSSYQRSRLNNGDNISSFNRYVAENPSSAYALQALLGPMIYRNSAKAASAVKKSGAKAVSKAIDFSSKFYKKANESTAPSKSGLIDMFNNKDIEKKLAGIYNDRQIAAIKGAIVMTEDGRQDVADKLLMNAGLKESDIGKFLSECKSFAKEKISKDLEKQASVLTDIAKDVILSSPMNQSLVAQIPSALATTAVLSLISKQLGKKAKDKETDNIEKH